MVKRIRALIISPVCFLTSIFFRNSCQELSPETAWTGLLVEEAKSIFYYAILMIDSLFLSFGGNTDQPGSAPGQAFLTLKPIDISFSPGSTPTAQSIWFRPQLPLHSLLIH